MPAPIHVSTRSRDVLLLVGTMKGAFILRADQQRRGWDVGGPYFPGSAVYAMAYDGREGRHRIWAGPNSMHWGGLLRSSDDFGRTWTNPEEANVKFPEGTGAALKQIWQIAPGREAEPDTLYCGVEPAAVFVSRDATPEGKLRVYRTRDGGGSWDALSNGLPQDGAYETVLRDAMAVDPLEGAGANVGSTCGKR